MALPAPDRFFLLLCRLRLAIPMLLTLHQLQTLGDSPRTLYLSIVSIEYPTHSSYWDAAPRH